jgi:hypothetical protein
VNFIVCVGMGISHLFQLACSQRYREACQHEEAEFAAYLGSIDAYLVRSRRRVSTALDQLAR